VKRLLIAAALLTATIAIAGTKQDTQTPPASIAQIPIPASIKGQNAGFYAFIGVCDLLQAKIFSTELISDRKFIAGMAAAFAIEDKIQPADRVEYLANFTSAYASEIAEDKAAPDSILKNH
jgi:hypothetical protein